MIQRESLLIVLVAAASGSALASASHALVQASAPTRIVPVAPSNSFAARSVGSSAQEDADESHAPTADNPYDEPAPARSAPTRISVPAKDGMLRLPGGRFTMGSSNPKAPANERPAIAANVSPFWLDRTEVTVAAYRVCVDAEACESPAQTSATCTYDAGDGALPVSCVHWGDADAYCRFAGKRLPTELEWEFAARGTQNVRFPWGAAPGCTKAVTLLSDQTGRSCAAGPAPVGTHPTGDSIFGVADMSGNVEEWTADWYSDSLGPGPSARVGSAHVLRGGGWLSPPSFSRTTSRDWGSALEAGANVGFRCARDE
jgi:formylglycine-generating enzyme required for sulfatase activity